MAFYTFSQNNSGGSFDYDEFRGITHHVVIEADNDDDALDRAKAIGLYFNGVDEHMDCPCCGDRWSDYLFADDAKEEPKVYGKSVTEKLDYSWGDPFQKGEIAVHYKSGDIRWFN